MFGDDLRSFWRGVLHNKVATLINVGGLALGLTVFFALTFYVYREFSWDAHWPDVDRVYTVSAAQESTVGTRSFGNSGPYVLGTSLLSRHPEAFEAYARVYFSAQNTLPSIDGTDYAYMPRYHVEPALLDIIQPEVLEGSFDDVFADPSAIAISANAAARFFGEESALGKVITFKATPGLPASASGPPMDFLVKAVYRIQEPSTLASMQVMAVLDTEVTPPTGTRVDLWQFQPPQRPPQPGQQITIEQPFNVSHYFKLREGVDAGALEADLRAFMDENRLMDNGPSKTRFVFRHLTDMHLTPQVLDVGDSVQRLRVYAALGVLVLLISGCNFVMLATLRLVDRMREVGVRKSVGGGGGQLMRQYLTDAFLHILLAATLAVIFLGFAFPKLSVMLQLPLRLDLLTARNLELCLLMVVLFTLISSLYPAWLSSQTKPGPLLRNGAGAVVGTGTMLRKLLVGLQFAIVVVLLLASAVVRQQIEYTRNRDRGYSLENVISLRITSADVIQRLPAILEEFRKVPGVDAATTSQMSAGGIQIFTPTPVRVLAPDGSVREAGLQPTSIGTDFFKVMSVPVLAGRAFSSELDAPIPGGPLSSPPGAMPGTGPRNVVLNAAGARALGFATPEAALEQLLEIETTTPDRQVRKQSLRVIGVVGDTQFSSAMMPPMPEFYNLSPIAPGVSVKVAADANLAAVTEALQTAWESVLNGTTPFVPQDMGALGNFQLQREEFEARVITASTILAIVIALLGLYGLVAATVIKRVKEIGVRKVMGAERSTIVTLFLLQFSRPIVVANVVAWPFGFWAIRQWLQRFPYQLDVSVIVLSGLGASIAALAIAWLTVGVMAARASSVKPVVALRYE